LGRVPWGSGLASVPEHVGEIVASGRGAFEVGLGSGAGAPLPGPALSAGCSGAGALGFWPRVGAGARRRDRRLGAGCLRAVSSNRMPGWWSPFGRSAGFGPAGRFESFARAEASGRGLTGRRDFAQQSAVPVRPPGEPDGIRTVEPPFPHVGHSLLCAGARSWAGSPRLDVPENAEHPLPEPGHGHQVSIIQLPPRS
jgi:hypothetical protein